MKNVHGWINIDKPKGISSFKAVSLVKKYFLANKAGHAGTLDPLASGVLPIALGEATKTTSYLMDSIKIYKCIVKWGFETSTDDAEGEIINSSNKLPSIENIKKHMKNFSGKINQVPPKFSAIKVNGQRSFNIARSGKQPNLKMREVFVYEFKLLDIIEKNLAYFYIKCSKGTYIRSLVRDLGRNLGVFAFVKELRRSAVGNFHEKNAISLDHLYEQGQNTKKNSYLLPLDSVLEKFFKFEVDLIVEKKLVNGLEIPLIKVLELKEAMNLKKDQMLLAMKKMVPIALCKLENEKIKPFRVFNF